MIGRRRRAGNAHWLPGIVVEARSGPAWLLATGVIRLAVIDVRRAHGAGGGLPRAVAAYGVFAAVGIADVELKEQPECLAVGVSLSAEADAAAVPAVAEHD